MTLRDTVLLLERIAAAQPAVRMIVRSDVRKLNTCPDARYGVFAWTQQQHSGSIDTWGTTFRFWLFYVDRLTEDGGNQLEIQSTAVAVLDNILRTAADAGLEVEAWTITTFNERFSDLCAGAWAAVTLRVPADTVCPEDFDDSDKFIKII